MEPKSTQNPLFFRLRFAAVFSSLSEVDQPIPQVSPTDENIDGFTPVHLAAKVFDSLMRGIELKYNSDNLNILQCGHADIFDTFAKASVSLKQPSSKIGTNMYNHIFLHKTHH